MMLSQNQESLEQNKVNIFKEKHSSSKLIFFTIMLSKCYDRKSKYSNHSTQILAQHTASKEKKIFDAVNIEKKTDKL